MSARGFEAWHERCTGASHRRLLPRGRKREPHEEAHRRIAASVHLDVIASDKLVHGTLDATFGGGALCYDAVSNRRECNDAVTFYVVEPTANVEINVTSFMRIAVGGGYRFAAVDDKSGPYKPDLSGFVTRTSIQFGRF